MHRAVLIGTTAGFWPQAVRDLVYDLSGGRVLDVTIPAGTPPLSHEDGLVYRTAVSAGEAWPVRYCVTGD